MNSDIDKLWLFSAYFLYGDIDLITLKNIASLCRCGIEDFLNNIDFAFRDDRHTGSSIDELKLVLKDKQTLEEIKACLKEYTDRTRTGFRRESPSTKYLTV